MTTGEPKMFQFYDIRGIWGKDLDPERAELLGAAFRDLIEGEVGIGRDARFSSDALRFHLSLGFGGEIEDLGITTTPMAYYSAWKEGMEVLQITASHNPPEYNGVKPVHADGRDWSPEEIRRLAKAYGKLKPAGSFKEHLFLDPIKDYFEFYRSFEVPKVSLGFDPSNGAGYLLTNLLKEKFDLKVINGVPDGRFPNHPPNPLLPESQKDILKLKTEWGVLLDGDGDRLVVKYRDRILGTDEVVAFLAENGEVGKVVALEVTMPLKLEEFLRDLGIKVIRTPTGRVLIKEMARDKSFAFFTEYSGHMGFREFNYIDDPLYAFFKVLEVGRGSFSTNYVPPPRSPVRSYKLSEEIVQRIVSELDPEEVITIDGFDLRTEDGRVVIRPSKTEPGLWRVFWEGKDEKSFETLSKKMEVVLNGAPEDNR